MGHDIYARPTDQEEVTPEYFRMNMSGPSAPLYTALNAEPHYAGVSGDGGEENYTREEIITAIQNFPSVFSDYVKLRPTAEQLKENYAWRFEKVATKYEWTQDETIGYYTSSFTSIVEFLIRCLAFFDADSTDSITISFH